MNLDDRLRTASAAMRGDGDDWDLRRHLKDLQLTYQQVADTSDMATLNDDWELFGALERAYKAAEAAETAGNLVDAATYFRVAADQDVGDAALRLALVLMRLGEYDEAAQWCAVADDQGYAQAAELLTDCLPRLHPTLPADDHPQRTVVGPVRGAEIAGRERAQNVGAAEDEATKRRRFLEHAASVTVGAAVLSVDSTAPPPSDQSWRFRSIGLLDVRKIEAATRAIRVLDHRYGGAACRAIVIDQLARVEPVLHARCTDLVWERLRSAVAELHTLAGWVSFDSGTADAAYSHFTRALLLAKYGRNEALVADILSRAGRMHLHHDAPEDALKLFQLGQLAATNSGSERHVAALICQEAWAYGRLGREDRALELVDRARREFLRSERWRTPPWTQFFDEIDLTSMIGAVHGALAETVDRAHVRPAIAALTAVVGASREERVRGRTIALTTLARSHLVDGNATAGMQAGSWALDLAVTLRSKRVDDHLGLLKSEVDSCRQPEAKALMDRLGARLQRAS